MRWVAGAGAGFVIFLAVHAVRSPVAQALRKGEPISGAVMGTDLAEHSPHSDTLMVWLYHPSEIRLDVISVPRDTKIDLPGYRFRRINEVFAYHYGKGRDAEASALKVCDAVGHLFAKARATLSPRYFVQVDFDGFRRVLDRLGGVTVAVDEPMDYDDFAGNFHVHLTTGVHHLKGEEALGFVRFRGRSGDRGRILRQMEFVQAVSKRLVSPEIVWRGPRAVAEVVRSVHTNLSFWDMTFLAVEARRLNSQRVNTLLLPGHPKGAAWEMDVERAAFVLDRLANGVNTEKEAAALLSEKGQDGGGIASPVSAVEGSSAPVVSGGGTMDPPSPKPITVKVWNASGRVGLAMTVVRRLRNAGFDVVEWGNYDSRQKKSRVIDRSGHFDRARRVGEALSLTSSYSDVDPALRTDVDVVLGEDFGLTEMREGANSWK